MCPLLLCACEPRRGDGTVIFSAANRLGTSSERGKGGTRLVAGDVTMLFLFAIHKGGVWLEKGWVVWMHQSL